MRILKLAAVFVIFAIFSIVVSKEIYASTELKPALTWQRSTEAQDKIVTESAIGTKVEEALALPLDPNQIVFDNGQFTPEPNKSNVPQGVIWSSWKQYSATSPDNCGPVFELRHFQAKFNLQNDFNSSSVVSIKLKSPYWPNNIFPINDNAYIYLNGNFITRVGTSYGVGSDPAIAETDRWYASGKLDASSIQFLKAGENSLDIAAGEYCRWGGMDKTDLVLEVIPGPTPFLDLPWDYQSKGLSFSEAALAINSYLDHEYPLLSSGLNEPGYATGILGFDGKKPPERKYSSHDGYDYGSDAGANIGDLVLAAATGCASYSWNSAGGNMIFINHGNGYQSRYLHLLDDGLITKSSSCIQVAKGQQVGKVGYTGNVIPPGEGGAHIHFMVVEDKNHDGNFDDNIPDGVTDPFGWQSTDPDPWPTYSFDYGGQTRTGSKSYYLWTKAIANLSQALTANGGFFQLDKFKVNVPQGATDENLNLHLEYGPTFKPSNILSSIGPSLIINAVNNVGQIIKDIQKPYGVEIDFSTFDLSPFNLGTISVYTSEDGVTWTKEPTQVDLQNKKASTEVNHMSYFALMAERRDTIAPTTTAVLNGTQSQTGWYRSDVQVNLNAQDNQDGLGVDYTLYKINNQDWQQYNSPINFTDAGDYTVQFYSVDRDENIEAAKSKTFSIDKTPPEAKISFNNSTKKTELIGIDANGPVVITTQDIDPSTKKITLTDKAGNTLAINGSKYETNSLYLLSIKSLSYNNSPAINFDYNSLYNYWSTNYIFQNWYSKSDIYLSIYYSSNTNKSTIYTLKTGQSLQTITKPGLVILQVKTNQGKLEYSY